MAARPAEFTDAAREVGERSWQRRLSRRVNITCMWAFVIGWVINIAHHPAHSFYAVGWGYLWDGDGIWITAVSFFFLYWIAAALYLWTRLGWRVGTAAFTPCPTPAEIDAELRAQGFCPSLQDVMAVHAAAKRQQYENVAVAVAYLAVNLSIGHHARARPQ